MTEAEFRAILKIAGKDLVVLEFGNVGWVGGVFEGRVMLYRVEGKTKEAVIQQLAQQYVAGMEKDTAGEGNED